MSEGLKFKKFDLHIHTPYSKDYKESGVTLEAIVKESISKGLSGIAITDHFSGKAIDEIKKIGKSNNLVIFPGVEIKTQGGETGVHIIVLFDTDKDSNHISQFLNTIGAYDCSEDTIVDKTVKQITEELQKFDDSSILVLAHSHSSQGVLGEIKGEARTIIFDKKNKCLLGAEANESDFIDEVKKSAHKRVIDCLDGSDPNYNNLVLGVYQSSDAHSLSEIGQNFTYFKVDNPITLEDIRQCLIDRDIRIRQTFEYKENIFPFINKIKVNSGFLKDQEIIFHEGLNSILGSKGSGKSLVIEFLRFALNKQPTEVELRKDHDLKLEKCLKIHGEVEIIITDITGKEYLIKRIYNPSSSNPIEIIDLSSNSEREFDIEKIFPVLFLSQNEVIKISEDREGKSQREFIDNFFDFYKYQQSITSLNKELNEIDLEFSDVLKCHLNLIDINKKIKTFEEEKEKLDRQINNEVFQKFSLEEKIGNSIKNQITFINTITDILGNTLENIDNLSIPLDNYQGVKESPVIKRILEISNIARDDAIKKLGILIDEIRINKINIEQESLNWEESFKSIELEFVNLVKAAGGNQIILDQKRRQLIQEINNLINTQIQFQNKAQKIRTISQKRKEILNNLEEAHKNYFKERKNRCEYFNAQSKGFIKVDIKEQGDKTAFKNNLLKFKKGSYLRDQDIEFISQKISPRDFIGNILSYELNHRKDEKYLKLISKKTNIPLDNIKRLVEYFLNEYDYRDILGLVYTSAPEDVPVISFKVGTEFKPITELSVGQKAMALLIIALSDGGFPVIIDQPEDSLDLRTIWENVCCKLRNNKEKRQFIFTTHNSSVAVASDSDKFTILESEANFGKALYSGTLSQKNIKKEVIDYLEGGKSTYYKKKEKYNL